MCKILKEFNLNDSNNKLKIVNGRKNYEISLGQHYFDISTNESADLFFYKVRDSDNLYYSIIRSKTGKTWKSREYFLIDVNGNFTSYCTTKDINFSGIEKLKKLNILPENFFDLSPKHQAKKIAILHVQNLL